MDIQAVDVGIQQEVRLTQEDLDSLSKARYLLRNSCTLQNNKIHGKFLCLDPNHPDDNVIALISEDEKLTTMSLDDVLTITAEGWVIGTQ